MKKYFIILILIVSSIQINAQNETSDLIIVADKLSSEQLYSIKSEGWVLLQNKGSKYLCNFSNPDYVLFLPVNCLNKSQKPNYLIEFSNNYREGDYGGIDFDSSRSDNYKKKIFLIDDVEFGNPFEKFDVKIFENFKNALRKGKIVTIKFFDSAYNSETGDEGLDLNREISFALANGELLETPIDCE
jgi:hypothetical protein